MEIFENGQWLPLAFALLFVVAMLAYAVLDGYDLGVGILMRYATPAEQDVMVASIGPFWDANETWLVLALGLLLIAFPEANGIVLENLYLPVFLMLIGLILRGVSFDLRAKAESKRLRERWNTAFIGGSFLAAITQGYMLGAYALGFENGVMPLAFCLIAGLAMAAAFSLIGASWLIMKTDGALQEKAIVWARKALSLTGVGLALFFGLLSMLSDSMAVRWTDFPSAFFPLTLLGIMGALLIGIGISLSRLAQGRSRRGLWIPFVFTAGVFKIGLVTLAYGFYPYIVPGRLTIVEAASAPESLMVILIGALVVLPLLFGYTFFAYKVFHGRTGALRYD